MSYFIYFNIPIPYIDSEIKYLNKIVNKCDTVIDIGANVGWYSLRLSKLVGACGKVLVFEPFGPSFESLSKTIASLSLKNISCVNKALGERDELVALEIPRLETGRINDPLVHVDPIGEGLIRMTTLDSEINNSNISSISFIKVDVEGYEYFVFKGAEKTILKYKPIILTEINGKWTKRYGISVRDVNDLLCSFGYDSYTLRENQLRRINVENSTEENFFYLPSKIN